MELNKKGDLIGIEILKASSYIRDSILDSAQAKLLEKRPQDYPKENKEIGKIQIGENVKVLRVGYGKDFRTWKVRGNRGLEGWFIENNDNIDITN